MEKNSNFSFQNKKVIRDNIFSYLSNNNFEVLPKKPFVDSWVKSSDEVGGIFEPHTGLFSRKRFEKCLNLTINDLSKIYDFNYIVFPELIVENVKLNSDSTGAMWDGVKRKLPGSGFHKLEWKKAPASSIVITVFNNDGDLHFLSKGGLEFMVKSTRKGHVFHFEKRNDLFKNSDNLTEGIKIAFHPFVFWEQYPK